MIVKKTCEPGSGKTVLQYSFLKPRQEVAVHLNDQQSKAWLPAQKNEITASAMEKILNDLNSRGVVSLGKQNGSPLVDQHSIWRWQQHLLTGQPLPD